MTTQIPGQPKRPPSEVWNALREEADASETAVVLNYWKGGLILANLSISKVPELVVQVSALPLTSPARKPSSIQVAGLEIWFENLTFNGSLVPSMVMRPKLAEHSDVFYALADHLVSNLANNEEIEASAEGIESVIAEWIRFWTREREEISRELLLGLLGELIALDQVLDLSGADYFIWEGPTGTPKDFRAAKDALEVKVLGTRTGPTVHKISSILQLQIPEDGDLYVLSVRVHLSANGQHSYDELVERVAGLPIFASEGAKSHFRSALEKAGYHKNLPVGVARFDIVELGIYEIRDDFPCLTKDHFPQDPRVMDITYSVDFSGAAEFLLPETDEKLKLN